MTHILKARVKLDLLKYTLRDQRNLLVIFSLLLAIPFPFAVLVRILSKLGPNSDSGEFYISLLLIGTILLLIGTPFIFFNYLTSKKSVDFMHALPIKRRDLFLTNAAISFLFVLIPFTVSYITGYLLLYSFEGLAFSMSHITIYFQLIALFAAVQVPTLFVIANTGTTSDSLIYSIILFLVPFITYGAFESFGSTYIIGADGFSSTNLLSFISPSVGLFRVISYGDTTISIPILIIYWIVFAFILLAFTIRLYEKWKSERSEQPFNNNVFFNFVTSIFVGVLLIFLLSIFPLDPRSPFKFLAIQNLLIPLLFTFATYIILDSIRRRSFQRLSKSIKRYSIIALVTLLGTTLVYTTQGFGYSRTMLEPSDVESVTLQSGFGYNDPLFAGLSYDKHKIEEPNEVAIVLSVHQNLVDTFSASNRLFNPVPFEPMFRDVSNSDYMSTSIEFNYKLKNGTTLKRTFNVPIEMTELLYPLLPIDVIQASMHPILTKYSMLSDVKLYNGLMSDEYSFDLDLIRETLIDEALSLDEKQLVTGGNDLEYIMTYTYQNVAYSFNLDARFPRTLDLLKGSIRPLGKTTFKHFRVSPDFISNSSIAAVFPLNMHSWVDDDVKNPLNREEVLALEGQIYSVDLRLRPDVFLGVELDLQYMIFIPLK